MIYTLVVNKNKVKKLINPVKEHKVRQIQIIGVFYVTGSGKFNTTSVRTLTFFDHEAELYIASCFFCTINDISLLINRSGIRKLYG